MSSLFCVILRIFTFWIHLRNSLKMETFSNLSLILKHAENFEIVHFLWSKSLFHHIKQTQPRTWRKNELLKRLLKCTLFLIYWMKHLFAWEKRFKNLRDKKTEALNEIKDFSTISGLYGEPFFKTEKSWERFVFKSRINNVGKRIKSRKIRWVDVFQVFIVIRNLFLFLRKVTEKKIPLILTFLWFEVAIKCNHC